MNENIKVNGAAITSMVLGIISCANVLLGFIFPTFFLISFPISIIGLCFANKAKKEECLCGQRTAGFVTSLIALCFSGFIILILVLVLFLGISIVF